LLSIDDADSSRRDQHDETQHHPNDDCIERIGWIAMLRLVHVRVE
jgi:hypothetical protein